MFRRLPDTGDATLAITLDGKPVRARPGDTVAATLFAAGLDHCRTTPVSGAPHGDRPPCAGGTPEEPCMAATCDGDVSTTSTR